MNKKWQKENENEVFEMQDTDWRKKFPLVEKILDDYEQFPSIYQKQYFYLEEKKIMFYIMSKYIIKDPPKSYIDIINKGYEDCNIDLKIKYRF